jgi:hypothetical protein
VFTFREQGVTLYKKFVTHFNEKLAAMGTKAFGTMWTFYIFFVWGILGMLPWLNDSFRNLVLLISSAWIQLFSLPLLAVGSAVQGRGIEKRAREDHAMIKAEFETLRSMMVELKSMHEDLHAVIKESGKPRSDSFTK